MSEREILFRGKRCDNGEWVEGLPIKTYDTELGTEIGKNSADYSKPVPVVLMASGRIVLECGYDEIPFFNIDEYPIVNPETISRYTGLTDKNGTRIFEGDIVKQEFSKFRQSTNGICEFHDSSFGLKIKDLGIEKFLPFACICNATYEVVGNIHDNPELLEGE